MLATTTTLGYIRVWDLDTFEQIMDLRDRTESNIEEFYVVKFTPDDQFVVAAGKIKDRRSWDSSDDDNKIMPCPIKIFDVFTGNVVGRLEGHSEEVLCLKGIFFREQFYFVSSSYDGTIYKWRMKEDFVTLEASSILEDKISNAVFSIAFVPNCGNKYLLAGCDHFIRLYDFETEELLQTFPTSYGSYCDCIKFIEPQIPVPDWVQNYSTAPPEQEIEQPIPIKLTRKPRRYVRRVRRRRRKGVTPKVKAAEKQASDQVVDAASIPPSSLSTSAIEESGKNEGDTENTIEENPPLNGVDQADAKPTEKCCYFLTRGVENVDEKTGNPLKLNTCHLRKLVFPKRSGGSFRVETITSFCHDEKYRSNCWLVKIASNGRYLAAPTEFGSVLFFTLFPAEPTLPPGPSAETTSPPSVGAEHQPQQPITEGFSHSTLVAAVSNHHSPSEVRDVMFHPNRPLFLSCGDDGTVRVYSTDSSSTGQSEN